jgi:hypothetical protein
MKNDTINHPAHYCDGGIETIDFIEAKKLNYRLGNAVKYISRAGKKGDAAEDIKKAIWYLNRELRAYDKDILADSDSSDSDDIGSNFKRG